MTKVIGITGGIASGKSLISNWLLDQGYPLIDADIVSRQVLKDNQKLLARISETFGPAMIQADGQLNRQKLGQVVFNDPAMREKLNAIMQAPIRQEIKEQLLQLKNSKPLVFLTVPLLFEEHYEDMCDAVIVVKVDADAQLSRLQERDNLDRQAALDRIKSQMPLEEKIARADFVIDNNGTVDQSIRQLKGVLASFPTAI